MRRVVAIVLVAAGLLLLGDAAATLLWQEPVSAVRAGAAQRSLGAELDRLERAQLRPADPHLSRRAVAGAARRFERGTADGHAAARLRIARMGLDVVVIRGSNIDDLRKGPGFITGSPLPGRHGTAAIAGHRTTYGAPFRRLNALRRGDPIDVALPYARFRYRVVSTRIVAPTDLAVLERARHDRLVLSACHPLFSAAQRIVVTARLAAVRPPDRRA
jgi:sortase A